VSPGPISNELLLLPLLAKRDVARPNMERAVGVTDADCVGVMVPAACRLLEDMIAGRAFENGVDDRAVAEAEDVRRMSADIAV